MVDFEASTYLCYIIYGHPPQAYLSSLLVEDVKSSPCASFLQMPENTAKYCVCVGGLPSM